MASGENKSELYSKLTVLPKSVSETSTLKSNGVAPRAHVHQLVEDGGVEADGAIDLALVHHLLALLQAYLEYLHALRVQLVGAAKRREQLVGAVAHRDRGDQRTVRADEGARADPSAVFAEAVIVHENRPGADIAAAANVGVAEIGQVIGLGALPHDRGLELDEVADMGIFANP